VSASGDGSLSLIGLTLRERGLVGDDKVPLSGVSFHLVSASRLAVPGLDTGVLLREGLESILLMDNTNGVGVGCDFA
jgi:hypothetical protein